MSIKQLNADSYSKESILVGILWGNPEYFESYSEDKLNKKTLGNTIWAFYLGLGRYLFKKNITVFDDISVHSAVTELKLNDKFEKYGGYELIEELIEESKPIANNFEAYYDEVKKYALLREYYKLFGDKVLALDGAYNYKKLNRHQIALYWNDKLNNIDVEHNDTKIVAYNLLENVSDIVNKLDIDPDIGMPFYRSKKFTELYGGWALGTLSIMGAFSGNGKSSYTVEKLLMSCIVEKEKLVLICNEMDLTAYTKLLLVTIMGTELYEKFKDHFSKSTFNRKRINQGNFTEEEKAKLNMAVEWIGEKAEDKSLIKFIPLEEYTIENLEKVIRKYNARGFERYVIDTAKPSSEKGESSRWEQFVEQYDKLYQLARNGGGGLNLSIWTTVQLADNHVGRYWITEQALADSKKIKNVADGLFAMRRVFPDEFKGGSKELKVVNYIPRSEDLFNQDDIVVEEVDGVTEYIKQVKHLEQGKTYYLMFAIKNRRGEVSYNGNILVYEVDFNSNRWTEFGWATNVHNDSMI